MCTSYSLPKYSDVGFKHRHYDISVERHVSDDSLNGTVEFIHPTQYLISDRGNEEGICGDRWQGKREGGRGGSKCSE